jgi:hypothetical protein
MHIGEDLEKFSATGTNEWSQGHEQVKNTEKAYMGNEDCSKGI